MRLIDKGPFDYLAIGLMLPEIQLSSRESEIHDNWRVFNISLTTSIYYSRDDNYKYLAIRVLGFGFYIARQTGY